MKIYIFKIDEEGLREFVYSILDAHAKHMVIAESERAAEGLTVDSVIYSLEQMENESDVERAMTEDRGKWTQ